MNSTTPHFNASKIHAPNHGEQSSHKIKQERGERRENTAASNALIRGEDCLLIFVLIARCS
jgi:hypothetical protein